MDTYDKLQRIEELEGNGRLSKASAYSTGQSIKIEYPCGCYIVQHLFSLKQTKEKGLERLEINRVFHVEICRKHKV